MRAAGKRVREGWAIKREEREERNGEAPRGLGETPGKEGKGGGSVCVWGRGSWRKGEVEGGQEE